MRKAFSLLLIGFLACVTGGTQTFSSSAFFEDWTGTTNLAFSLTSMNVTTGNLVVVYVFIGSNGVVAAIAGTGGDVFTRANGKGSAGNNYEMWYKVNATGSATYIVAVTTTSALSNFESAVATQYSGVATAGAFDATAIGAAATTGTFTTAQANEVIVVGGGADPNPPAGLIGGVTATIRVHNPNFAAMEDLTVTSIQTGITAAIGGSGNLGTIAASFKAPGASSAVPRKRGGIIP